MSCPVLRGKSTWVRSRSTWNVACELDGDTPQTMPTLVTVAVPDLLRQSALVVAAHVYSVENR